MYLFLSKRAIQNLIANEKRFLKKTFLVFYYVLYFDVRMKCGSLDTFMYG